MTFNRLSCLSTILGLTLTYAPPMGPDQVFSHNAKGPGLNLEAISAPARFAHKPLEATLEAFAITHLPGPARRRQSLQPSVAALEKNLQRIEDALNPARPYSGYDIIVVVTASTSDRDVQQRQMDALYKGRARVLSLCLPVSGGGPTMDVLRAYRIAKRDIPNLDQLWRQGKKIALILNSGEGRRDSPLTQSENNSRGAIRIGGSRLSPSGEVPMTLVNAAYAQNNLFATSNIGGMYLDVFYANQIYLPNVEIAASPNAPFVKFATVIRDPGQLTPESLRDLGLYEISTTGEAFQNLPKNTFSTVAEAWAWVQNIRASGHEAAYSLGSHRLRRDFLNALDAYYGNLLEDRSATLQPPDIVSVLLILAQIYRTVPAKAWQKFSEFDDLTHRLKNFPGAKPFIAQLEGAPKAKEIVRFYLMYRKRFGEDPRSWFGVFPVGEDIHWWRYRQPLSILNNQLLLLSDLANEKVQIDRYHPRISFVLTDRDREEARALRRLQGISHPITNSHLGNVWISPLGIRSDNGRAVTFNNIRTGVEIGGVFVRGSIIIDSALPSGSRVIQSFIDHRRGEVDALESFIGRSYGQRIVARQALVYNVVNQNPLEIKHSTVADVFRPGIPEYPNRGLLTGQTRMWIDFRYDASAFDEVILPNNSYTFRQLREMKTDPALDERVRQRIKETLEARNLPGATTLSNRTVLVIGASGFLGKKIYSVFSRNFSRVIGTSYSKAGINIYHLDVTDEAQIKACILRFKPDLILYAAGEADPVRSELNPERAWAVNAGAVKLFAKYFKGHFIYISSDYVFDGTHPPYTPSAPVSPNNEYGRSKVAGEALTINSFAKASIIRSGLLYGYNDANDRETFFSEVIHHLDHNQPMVLDNVQIRHPALIDEVASLALTISQQGTLGTFHIDGSESVTKFDLAKAIAHVYFQMFPQSIRDIPISRILESFIGVPSVDLRTRPKDSKLASSIAAVPLASGIRRVMRDISYQLKGGSYSKTWRLFQNGEWIVRKEAFDQGRMKLINEISWLRNLPNRLRVHFPTVLTLINGATEVAYEMPLYPLTSLTRLIIDYEWTAKQVGSRLHRILQFYTDEVISQNREAAPPNYAEKFLVNKIVERTAETLRLSPTVFADIVQADYVYINGHKYKNTLPLIHEVLKAPDLMDHLRPPFLSLFHGDLHLDNILVDSVDENTFILLDPRGDRVGDPIYDLAKMLHTLVGKYDIFNYDLHQASVHKDARGISINIAYPTDRDAWKVYQGLGAQLPDFVQNSFLTDPAIANDPHWLERLAFTHAELFASDTPFHLKGDGKEERAIAIYAMGVILINQYMDFARGRTDSYFGLRMHMQSVHGSEDRSFFSATAHRTVGISA